MATTGGIERGIDEGAEERVEAPCVTGADLGLKGGGHKEWMVAQLDRLDSGVRRVSAHRHAVLGEEWDVLFREPIAAPVEALERLVSADACETRPRNRFDQPSLSIEGAAERLDHQRVSIWIALRVAGGV
jgi:hypothetical protein